MSKFFKALEQAEHDRRLRDQGRRPEGNPPAPSPPAREPVAATVAIPEPPPPATQPVDERAFDTADHRIWATEPARRGERSTSLSGEIEGHLVSLLNPTSAGAEQYRALRHAIEQLHRTSGLSVIGVSSPTVGDGKTTTAINLAGALAQDPDARVLLIDADLRRASLGERLGLSDSRRDGLVDAILDGSVALEDVVRRRPPYNLALVAAGRMPAAPYEVLKSPRFGSLLDQARQHYDFIILDTSPVLVAQDCRVIAKWVDGLVLVVAAGKTPAKLVEEALNRMEPKKIVGFVFNDDARSLTRYDSHGYGYGPVPEKDDGKWWWRRVRQRLSV